MQLVHLSGSSVQVLQGASQSTHILDGDDTVMFGQFLRQVF